MDRRQKSVRDIFVARHPALQSANAQNPRTQGYVVMSGRDHSGQRSKQPWRVLVIRMQHDHDVGISLERFSITSLLVLAVAEIFLM